MTSAPLGDHPSGAAPESFENIRANANVVIAGPGASVNIGVAPVPASASLVTVLRVTDINAYEDDVSAAIELYGRLPEEERYDDDVFVDLIRHHLAGDFGVYRPAAHWKAFFFIAKIDVRVVGMLLAYAYDDHKDQFLYVPYLVASRPRPNEQNAKNVSQALIDELVRLQRTSGSQHTDFCILTEVEDPAETDDPLKRLQRRSRIRLFGRIAGFAGLNLRCLEYKFTQPKLEPWIDTPEKQLLLLYGSQEQPPPRLPRAALLRIITWLYKQLYAANMPENPEEAGVYRQYLDGLLRNAVANMPESVRLLRLHQIYRDSTVAGTATQDELV
jgi:hypothetical protein